MTTVPRWWPRGGALVVTAVLVPLVVTLLVVPFRDSFANTNAALILVLVIVGVAANGNRVAGAAAALSSAVWFDFFLTQPYQTLAIDDRDDIETTVLLLAVGVGVTELAVWGRRHAARADREAAYMAGIRVAAEAVASGGSGNDVIGLVSEQLRRVLDLKECRFQFGAAGLGQPPRLRHDGQVEWHRRVLDVDRDGLPTDNEIELLVESSGRLQGRFMLRAAPNARPSLAQRLVAVTLADQVGAALV
jgi:K+-sensing histidine kinase KdpD